MDDILLYSPTMSAHIELLKQVFQILHSNKFFVKQSKCTFGQSSFEYLGHIISTQGVAIDPSKIKAIQAWPAPTSVKEVRIFLGPAGYYRKFIEHYGVLSHPLTSLWKKNVQFI